MSGENHDLTDLLDEAMSVIASSAASSVLWPETDTESRVEYERQLAQLYDRAQIVKVRDVPGVA